MLEEIVVKEEESIEKKKERIEIFEEKRKREIFGIGKKVMKKMNDGKEGIEEDEVGKLKRKNRMVREKINGGIDRLKDEKELIESIDWLVDNRKKDEVEDERREVLGKCKGFEERGEEIIGIEESILLSGNEEKKLEEINKRKRINEVNEDEELREIGSGWKKGNGNRWSIGWKNGLRVKEREKMRENIEIDGLVLSRRIDGKIEKRKIMNGVWREDKINRVRELLLMKF